MPDDLLTVMETKDYTIQEMKIKIRMRTQRIKTVEERLVSALVIRVKLKTKIEIKKQKY